MAIAESTLDVTDRYLSAIARRNTTWTRYQDAKALLAMARDEIGFYNLQPYIINVNETQYEYEHAGRDLVRARVWFRAEQAA